MALPAGAELGQYRVISQLGQGGTAAAYRAAQPGGPDVALKIVDAALTGVAGFSDRFRARAAALMALRHTGILPVLDYGETAGQAFLTYPLVEGGTLRAMLGRPLPAADVVRCLGPVAAALDYAHAQGIAHGNLKPRTILLTPDGAPLITDFGLTGVVGADAGDGDGPALLDLALGTPAYMAPEQVQGRPVDARTDQYALGVVAYQMVTGSVPYASSDPEALAWMHVREPLPAPRTRNPAIAPAIEQALFRALAKDPAERFAGCSAFIAALAAAPGLTAHAAGPLPPRPEMPHPVPPSAAASPPVSPAPRQVTPAAGPVDAPPRIVARTAENAPALPAAGGPVNAAPRILAGPLGNASASAVGPSDAPPRVLGGGTGGGSPQPAAGGPADTPPAIRRSAGATPSPLRPQTSARPAMTCPRCGTGLAAGMQFCPACGAAAPAPVARQPRAASAESPPIFAIGVGLGCALALLATFLPWLSVRGGRFFINGWHPNVPFQVSDWLGVRVGRWDAAVVAVLVLAGLGLVPPLVRGLGAATVDYAAAAVGTLIFLMGVIEVLYINRRGDRNVSIGIGTYVLIAGGLIAAGSAVAGTLRRRQAR